MYGKTFYFVSKLNVPTQHMYLYARFTVQSRDCRSAARSGWVLGWVGFDWVGFDAVGQIGGWLGLVGLGLPP